MITNEKQYRSTRAALDQLKASAGAPVATNVDPAFAVIARANLKPIPLLKG